MAKKDPLTLIYERMLNEAVSSNDDEYYNAVGQHYDQKLVQQIKSQDKMASQFFGAPIETYKTEDGSMIVRYIDSDELVAVLGIVAVPGVEKTNYMKDLFKSGGKITDINIRDEMKQSFIDYAMSVIVSRALPDVRDGMKPVHRRILYAMHENNITHIN